MRLVLVAFLVLAGGAAGALVLGCNTSNAPSDGDAQTCPSEDSISEGASCSSSPGLFCPSAARQACCGATTGTGTVQFCACGGGTWACTFYCTAICEDGGD